MEILFSAVHSETVCMPASCRSHQVYNHRPKGRPRQSFMSANRTADVCPTQCLKAAPLTCSQRPSVALAFVALPMRCIVRLTARNSKIQGVVKPLPYRLLLIKAPRYSISVRRSSVVNPCYQRTTVQRALMEHWAELLVGSWTRC